MSSSSERISRGRNDDRLISASEIAELGFCERFVVLTARHGRRHDPPDVSAARERGNRAHEEFFNESVAIANGQRTPSKRPCFMEMRVFEPNAHELVILRRMRDELLSRTVLGRWVIALYDKACPWLVNASEHKPAWAIATLRRSLSAVALLASLALRISPGAGRAGP
jgi:hypothetical protein